MEAYALVVVFALASTYQLLYLCFKANIEFVGLFYQAIWPLMPSTRTNSLKYQLECLKPSPSDQEIFKNVYADLVDTIFFRISPRFLFVLIRCKNYTKIQDGGGRGPHTVSCQVKFKNEVY